MRRYSGFTLIEMLLVIIIIGIITAIAAPQFAKSMRGNRLRAAARSVVGAGRYARSMAVIHQRPMVITFDLENSTLLVALGSGKTRPSVGDDDDKDVSALDDMLEMSEDQQPAGMDAGVEDRLERTLDNVTIAHIEIEGEESNSDGVCRVVYESNGRCIPYEVRLVDADGRVLTIKVDALASAITVGDRE